MYLCNRYVVDANPGTQLGRVAHLDSSGTGINWPCGNEAPKMQASVRAQIIKSMGVIVTNLGLELAPILIAPIRFPSHHRRPWKETS